MNRSSLVRALFAFLVLAASTYVVLTARPELGLDLRGGTQIVLEAKRLADGEGEQGDHRQGDSRCCAAGSTRSASASRA